MDPKKLAAALAEKIVAHPVVVAALEKAAPEVIENIKLQIAGVLAEEIENGTTQKILREQELADEKAAQTPAPPSSTGATAASAAAAKVVPITAGAAATAAAPGPELVSDDATAAGELVPPVVSTDATAAPGPGPAAGSSESVDSITDHVVKFLQFSGYDVPDIPAARAFVAGIPAVNRGQFFANAAAWTEPAVGHGG